MSEEEDLKRQDEAELVSVSDSDKNPEKVIETKPCWVYDERGYFNHESFAQSNIQANEDDFEEWIKPINSTFIQPTFETGRWPVWTGSYWELLEDNRGTVYDSKTNVILELKDLGPLPKELTKNIPNPKAFIAGIQDAVTINILTANKLISTYTTLEKQLLNFNWENSTALLKDAISSKILKDADINAIKKAIKDNFLPISL